MLERLYLSVLGRVQLCVLTPVPCESIHERWHQCECGGDRSRERGSERGRGFGLGRKFGSGHRIGWSPAFFLVKLAWKPLGCFSAQPSLPVPVLLPGGECLRAVSNLLICFS